jgi:hypothetical protein
MGMDMREYRVDRRQILMGSGVVGASVLAGLVVGCGTGAAPETGNGSTALDGTWRLDVTLDDGTKHQALMVCTKDGGLVTTATLASDSFAYGYGVWTRSGSQYLITFEAYVSTAGKFAGGLRIRAVPTLDQSGDQLTATVKFDLQPPGATGFTPGGGAKWTGSRIKPLAL